jgi:MSHA biogenesis protein MshN
MPAVVASPPPPEHPHTATPSRARKAAPADSGAVAPPAYPAGPAQAAPPAAAAPSAVSYSTAQSELARANELISHGQAAEAEQLLQSALAQQPALHEARLTLAALLADRGERRAALGTLLDGAKLDPARFALTAAQLQAELDDPQGALQTLDRVAPAARGEAFHSLAAAVAQRAGRHEQAVEEYGQSLHSDPTRVVAWVGLGISLQALGRDAQALDAFQNASKGNLSERMQRFVRERVAALQASVQALAATPASR